MKRLSIILLLIAGCGSSVASDAPPAFDAGYIRAQIAVIDADDATFVPDLPDDFGKKQGEAPEVTTEPPATVPETVPDPPTEQPGGTVGKRFSGTVLAPPVSPAVIGDIYYYPKSNCPPCRNSESDQPTLTEFRFIKALPDAWSKRQTEGFPHFRWMVDGKWSGEAHGWYGPAAFREAFKRSQSAPASAKSDPSNRSGAAFYPIRGNWWSGCGSWQHLTQGEHRGKFDPAWLSRLSWAEIQSLHSDDHDHRVKWQYVNKFSQTRVRYKASSLAMVRACPS